LSARAAGSIVACIRKYENDPVVFSEKTGFFQ